MAYMVFIREIYPRSFLHFSTAGESFVLRDFSQPEKGSAIKLAKQSEGCTAATIHKLASKPGNHIIEIPGKGMGVKEYSFWHEQTLKLNAQYVELPSPPQTMPSHPAKSWIIENIVKVAVGVITAVSIAVVLAWLGLKA